MASAFPDSVARVVSLRSIPPAPERLSTGSSSRAVTDLWYTSSCTTECGGGRRRPCEERRRYHDRDPGHRTQCCDQPVSRSGHEKENSLP